LTVETLHAKQKARKQGRDDSVKQFSIQPHPIDLSTLKIWRVELCTELFYVIIPTFFPCMLFFWSAISNTSCYVFCLYLDCMFWNNLSYFRYIIRTKMGLYLCCLSCHMYGVILWKTSAANCGNLISMKTITSAASTVRQLVTRTSQMPGWIAGEDCWWWHVQHHTLHIPVALAVLQVHENMFLSLNRILWM